MTALPASEKDLSLVMPISGHFYRRHVIPATRIERGFEDGRLAGTLSHQAPQIVHREDRMHAISGQQKLLMSPLPMA